MKPRVSSSAHVAKNAVIIEEYGRTRYNAEKSRRSLGGTAICLRKTLKEMVWALSARGADRVEPAPRPRAIRDTFLGIAPSKAWERRMRM
jgi:hypothetical protein